MRQLSEVQLEANLKTFTNGSGKNTGLLPNARYASFDYCYNYFQGFREKPENIIALSSSDNIQMSALQLGFYLASWGMYRGSAELLQLSVRHLIPLIELIAETKPDLWKIDIDNYQDEQIEKLISLRNDIKQVVRGQREASDILATKIMLGVFGNVPAFDTQFTKGSEINYFNRESLKMIREFYKVHKDFLDRQEILTHDFLTGERTALKYPKAKILDMIFFIEGGV